MYKANREVIQCFNTTCVITFLLNVIWKRGVWNVLGTIIVKIALMISKMIKTIIIKIAPRLSKMIKIALNPGDLTATKSMSPLLKSVRCSHTNIVCKNK